MSLVRDQERSNVCVCGGGGGKGALDPPSRYRNISTNSPCQHLRKCKENSMENMNTDARV